MVKKWPFLSPRFSDFFSKTEKKNRKTKFVFYIVAFDAFKI